MPPSSPSQSVHVKKIKTKKTVKFNPHPYKEKEEGKEPQNIFGHMADALGMQTVKLAKGQIPLLERIKKIVIGLGIYMAMGYIIGMICDMFFQTSVSFANVFALVMLFIWILKNGKKYLT